LLEIALDGLPGPAAVLDPVTPGTHGQELTKLND
jgi:hypothetical protein